MASLKSETVNLPHFTHLTRSSSLDELPELDDLEPLDDLYSNKPDASVSTHPDRPNPKQSSTLRFKCGQWFFAESIAFVKSYAPSKTNHPILTNVLIQSDKASQTVTLTASDLIGTATATFNAIVETSGALLLPIDAIATVIRTCPSKGLIKVWSDKTKEALYQTESYVAQIKDSEDGYTELQGRPSTNFPEFRSITGTRLRMPVKVALAALKSAFWATSNDNTKVPLNAILWRLHVQREILECHATDGHQVVITQSKTGPLFHKSFTDKNLPDTLEATIPAKLLKELVKVLEKSEAKAILRFISTPTTNQIHFELEENGIKRGLTIQCYDTPFPDCKNLLSHYKFTHAATLDRAGLLNRLERLSALVDNDVNGVILQFNTSTQKAHLGIERNFGKGMQTISANIPPTLDGFGIKLNIKYLKNAIKALLSPKVALIVDSASTPCEIQSSGETGTSDINIRTSYFIAPQYDQSSHLSGEGDDDC